MFLGHPLNQMTDFQLFRALRTEEGGWFVVLMNRTLEVAPGLDDETRARLAAFERRLWDAIIERSDEGAELINAYRYIDAPVFSYRIARHSLIGYALLKAFRARENTGEDVCRYLVEQLKTRARDVADARRILREPDLRWLPINEG
jgi:hypothetical protein